MTHSPFSYLEYTNLSASLGEKPFAYNLALYLSMNPSGWYFFLKIHLQPMGFALLGKFTKVQVLFFLIDSISILIALSYYFASGALVASKKIVGSFSTG